MKWLKKLKCRLGYHDYKKTPYVVYDDRFEPSYIEYESMKCRHCNDAVIYNGLFKSYRIRKN